MTETQELQQLEEKLKELTSQLDALKSKRVEYSQRLDKAEQECRKAEDYHHVMNLMSAHMHCCLNQEYRRELDEFWSSRDDIAYANGDIAYIGRKAVYAHYAVKAEKRAVTAGRDDGKTPGYRQFNLIGTPYVEIAGDGQTAIGIWMSHSYNASAEDGDVSCQGVLGRYSGEFIKENGVWKIGRRRCYVDLVADLMAYGVEGESFNYDGNGKPQWNMDKLNELAEANGYSPSTVAEFYYGIKGNFVTLSQQDALWAFYDQAQIDAIEIFGDKSNWGDYWGLDVTLTTEENTTIATVNTDIRTFISEQSMKFITGELNINDDATWEAFKQGISDLGQQTVQEIYEAAYARTL